MKKLALTFLAAAALLPCSGKRPLDHDSFDSWEAPQNFCISNNGEWAAFAVNPQEGDGQLTFYNTKSRKKFVIPRGYNPSFTADGTFAVALIKPFFQDTRKAKMAKKKDFDLPQDSLVIVNLLSGAIEKTPDVISYKIGKEGGNWIAFKSCDTTYIKPKALKDKKAGKPLLLKDMAGNHQKIVNWVDDYTFSRDGKKIAVNLKKQKEDSLATDGVGIVYLPDTSLSIIDRDKDFYSSPVFSRDGMRLAYTASTDTFETGTLRCQLYLADCQRDESSPRKIDFGNQMPKDYAINQYCIPRFSRDGKRLISGVAPVIAPDDTTLVDFEKGSLDIWRWDAPLTPPQANINIDKLRKKNIPMVTDIATGRSILTTDKEWAMVDVPADTWNSDWVLIADPTDYMVEQQWNYTAPVELSVKNVSTGESKNVSKSKLENYGVSGAGKYVIWFDDRNYHCYEVATGNTVNLTKDIPYPVWDETDDHPMDQSAYGVMGWTDNDGAMLVYDRYDIWSLDPQGKRAPLCLTGGEGRATNVTYRYHPTDPEETFIPASTPLLLDMFNHKTKEKGLATIVYNGKAAKPATRLAGGFALTQVRKALEAPVYSWQKANFETSPNLFISRGLDFTKAEKVTDTNPQMAEYSWGTAHLVNWYTYNGRPAEGAIFLPEDFDPNKKYPMLAVFYETRSEDLYEHVTMQPSWSWVNFAFYVSRGYVVFGPDIHYTPGIPGENAYDYVCSGVEEMCKQFPNIDKSRIGIDGQSWGGYQTAFLVTRTNMFACAGSGAPVANMTSAFGGIRWESGDSRQGQYEQGQSRIGRNLWDAPELYIYNSPVFHADRVNTPLLIMHNDADGAVPWYQGIEMFMALRRLQKPVWMLQYNSEAHNLKERRNRKDITKRLQQFFDHYLKGDPMPKWMKEGISPLRKGQDYGFELIESSK